jgi:hypothetical protein
MHKAPVAAGGGLCGLPRDQLSGSAYPTPRPKGGAHVQRCGGRSANSSWRDRCRLRAQVSIEEMLALGRNRRECQRHTQQTKAALRDHLAATDSGFDPCRPHEGDPRRRFCGRRRGPQASCTISIRSRLSWVSRHLGCRDGRCVAGAGGVGSHKTVRATRISTGYDNNPHIGRERK